MWVYSVSNLLGYVIYVLGIDEANSVAWINFDFIKLHFFP